MTVAAKKIAEQALALSDGERTQLLHLLQDSLQQHNETLSQEEWDEAWKRELETRLADMENGNDPGVKLEVVLEDLRKIADRR